VCGERSGENVSAADWAHIGHGSTRAQVHGGGKSSPSTKSINIAREYSLRSLFIRID